MTPAFKNPVRDSQAAFRAVLDAMARPGVIHRVTTPAEPPPPLDRATAAILLTLADIDTPIALDHQATPAADWITFHCGAPLTTPDRASFVVAFDLPDLATLQLGTDDGPEESATVILQLEALGTGPAIRLEGPGIQTHTTLNLDLPPDLIAAWAANHARFPRGVDLILCAGDRLAAIPRTTRITGGA